MTPTRIRAAMNACLGTALCLGAGCAGSGDRSASPGLLAGSEELLTLGAGDALGVQVYINDLIIAAREMDDSVATLTSPDPMFAPSDQSMSFSASAEE